MPVEVQLVQSPWWVLTAQALGGFSALALAFYAGAQLVIARRRELRESTPHIIVTGEGDPKSGYRLKVANLSADVFWVQHCSVENEWFTIAEFKPEDDFSAPLRMQALLPRSSIATLVIDVPRDPYTGEKHTPGDTLPDDPVVVLEGYYGPTGQSIHQFAWRLADYDGALEPEVLVAPGL